MGGGADTNANWKKLASRKISQEINGHRKITATIFFASVPCPKVWKLKMPKGARLVLQISEAT